MGCGCSKGGNRNTSRSSGVLPNSVSNRTVTPQNTTAQEVQAQQRNVNPTDRRNIEKIRKEAIRRALGR